MLLFTDQVVARRAEFQAHTHSGSPCGSLTRLLRGPLLIFGAFVGEMPARFASEEWEMGQAATGNVRFFSRSGPYPPAIVAQAACGIARERDLVLEGVAPLQTAGPNEGSFLDNRRYASALEQTLAGAVIVHPDMEARVPAATVPILFDRAICALGPGRCTVPSRAPGFARYPPVGNCG
jgi:hypothetical protein